MIASDVIELLPRALAGTALSNSRTLTAASAGPRQPGGDRAQRRRLLRDRLTPARALCAVVKADGYGHGAVPAARAALAGGATRLAVATAGEAAELRAGGSRRRSSCSGALSAEELPVALRPRADVVAWDERFVARRAAAVSGRCGVHVKLDTRHGPARDARP